ncbi:hypothetical protein HBB16_04380 [Pseudonocardia sp. MCCB 268]|nr:hypothetical protein [Pseudonocardia cytotoxica]
MPRLLTTPDGRRSSIPSRRRHPARRPAHGPAAREIPPQRRVRRGHAPPDRPREDDRRDRLGPWRNFTQGTSSLDTPGGRSHFGGESAAGDQNATGALPAPAACNRRVHSHVAPRC